MEWNHEWNGLEKNIGMVAIRNKTESTENIVGI